MSFELYLPQTRAGALTAGQVTICKSGLARLHPSDLEQVGIEQWATILFDDATKRIALRSPRRADDGVALDPAAPVKRGKTSTAARINLNGPLKKMGVTPADVASRQPREVTIKDGLLIIIFPELLPPRARAGKNK